MIDSSISIKPMSRNKLFGYAVEKDKFPYFLYEEDFRKKVYSKFIRDDSYCDSKCSWFALYQDNALVGIFATFNEQNCLKLSFLEICKYKKGMGYGTYIINHLKSTNEKIRVIPRNELARDFYTKNGFKSNDIDMLWTNNI